MTKGEGQEDGATRVVRSRGRKRPIHAAKQSYPLCSNAPSSPPPAPCQRRVSFASSNTIFPPTNKIDDGLWYDKADLVAFRASARAISNRVKLSAIDRIILAEWGHAPAWKIESLVTYRSHLAMDAKRDGCEAECDAILAEEGPGCPRGLEIRSSFERLRDRGNIVRTVLKAQERLRQQSTTRDLDNCGMFDMSLPLAIVASQATTKARTMALEAASADFAAAYDAPTRTDAACVSSDSCVRPLKRKRNTTEGRREDAFFCRREATAFHGEPLILSPL